MQEEFAVQILWATYRLENTRFTLPNGKPNKTSDDVGDILKYARDKEDLVLYKKLRGLGIRRVSDQKVFLDKTFGVEG